MTIHKIAVEQPKKMLQNLTGWLEKAAAFAEENKFEPDVLLVARLAPNQFTLARQIQSAADTAKFIAARLGGVDAPSFADDEKTFGEIRQRVSNTIEFLDGVKPEALQGWEAREIKLSFLPEGQWMRAADYLHEFAVPNFYFHITTAYAIMRHNGVPLGKYDFIGRVELQGAS